jgi:small subunit ribosomal protein S18
MHNPKSRSRDERKTGLGGAGQPRRRSCSFCREKVKEVDYKNVAALRRVLSDKGKIRSRRVTGVCRRHQNQLAVAVKRAREVALAPTVTR